MIRWEGGEEPIRLMLKEGLRYKWRLVFGFVVICSAGVLLGLAWPKTYISSVTLSIEQENVIDPLMEGRAVRTANEGTATDNARELVLSRSVLLAALREHGEIDEETTAVEREHMLVGMRGSTEVTEPAENLVRIEYTGSEPAEVREMTERLGQLFIEQIVEGQSRESEAAFRFIDRQAEQYEKELQAIQESLEQVRSEHPVAESGAAERLSERKASLTDQAEELEQQLEEARIRESSLQQQLDSEAVAGASAAAGQAQETRLQELREELADLRTRYHDSYPDIAQLKRQIEALEQAQAQDSGDGGQTLAGVDSPLQQSLTEDLYGTRTEIQTLSARLEATRSRLAQVREKQQELQSVQGRISKLERDYEVNQDIYEDLLRRRENAKVSRDLDADQKGLNVRVQEPAFKPSSPEGPRALHFALAGGVLGAGVPVGLLLLMVMLDPRIRDVSHLPIETGSVLLTTIPHARTRIERRVAPWGIVGCVLVVIGTVVGLAALMWMKTNNVL